MRPARIPRRCGGERIWTVMLRTTWRALHATNPFGAGAALTAAANLAIAVLSIVTGVVSARLLGPHGRGELAAIQTTPGFLASLAMLGMPEALTYFSAQEPEPARAGTTGHTWPEL